MRIGELATQVGVNIQTIRFYERRGLLKKPHRTASGYRDYPTTAVEVVRFIKQMQEHGFTLREIEYLLRLLAAGSLSGAEARAGLEAKVRSLDEKIGWLQTMRRELNERLDTCECRDGQTLCPDLKAIAECIARG
ncbi:MAG: MerR family transcriptional regulator [Blastocatellia bacterium]